VKLLFDENLSYRLIPRIRDLFRDATHVGDHGLLHASDLAVWEFAKAGEFAIVTADSDFYELATNGGQPPKVIWLRGCDYPNETVERLLRGQAIRIAEFLDDQEASVLILRL
jgi:predicted nuclease of predicted toxin-antitoxin system